MESSATQSPATQSPATITGVRACDQRPFHAPIAARRQATKFDRDLAVRGFDWNLPEPSGSLPLDLRWHYPCYGQQVAGFIPDGRFTF